MSGLGGTFLIKITCMLVTPVGEVCFGGPSLNITLEAVVDGSVLVGTGSSDFDGEWMSGSGPDLSYWSEDCDVTQCITSAFMTT